MLSLQRLQLLPNDHFNQRVRQQDGVEVVKVTLEFVVETHCTQAEVDLFASSNGLLRQDDLLDLHLDLAEDFYVDGVEGFEFVEQGLQFEQAQFLDGLWCVGVEDLLNDFNGNLQRVLNCRPIGTARGTRARLVHVRFGAAGDTCFEVFFAGEQVAVRAELRQDRAHELQALGFDFPVVLVGELGNVGGHVKDAFCVVLSDSVQHVQGVDADG